MEFIEIRKIFKKEVNRLKEELTLACKREGIQPVDISTELKIILYENDEFVPSEPETTPCPLPDSWKNLTDLIITRYGAKVNKKNHTKYFPFTVETGKLVNAIINEYYELENKYSKYTPTTKINRPRTRSNQFKKIHIMAIKYLINEKNIKIPSYEETYEIIKKNHESGGTIGNDFDQGTYILEINSTGFVVKDKKISYESFRKRHTRLLKSLGLK